MSTEETLSEISLIKERNQRVEIDKAWEISWARKIIIAVVTYIVALLFLYAINESLYFLKALIPTGGYILSTLTLGSVKEFWVKNMNSKKSSLE